MPVKIHSLFLLTSLLAATSRAADWPAFQGSDRNGSSAETGLARSWPKDGPRVLWKLDLGYGWAGAAVRDGQVHVLDRDGQNDVLRCIDLETGKPQWQLASRAPGVIEYPGSRNIPTVEERFIYTVGPTAQVSCVNRATHESVWQRNLVDEFRDAAAGDEVPPAAKLDRTQVPRWGFTQHPAVYKDLLILAPHTRTVGAIALDKATGKTRWTSPYVGRNWFCHTSPTLVTLAGVDQVLLIGQPSDPEKWPPAMISGVDAATGKLLWQTQTSRSYKIPIALPLAIGGDRLFLSSGYRFGCATLSLRQEAGHWTTDFELKDNNNCFAHIQNPLLYRGHIYASSDQPVNALVCLDLKGEVRWKSPAAFTSGNLIIADGMIFIMNGRTGELALVEARPDAYQELARAKVLSAKGGMAWAPMALSNGRLIVRDLYEMKCLDVR